MTRRNPSIRVGTGALLALGLIAAAWAQDGDIERGRELFYVHGCYGCHGITHETDFFYGEGLFILANRQNAIFIGQVFPN